jgi:hypothetical protein
MSAFGTWRRFAAFRNLICYPRCIGYREAIGAIKTNRANCFAFTRKRNLAIQLRQNNPTGKSPKTLSSPAAKNIPLSPSRKSVL